MTRGEDVVVHHIQALCPGMVSSRHHHVPRAPLPTQGVTSSGVTSGATSEGITPPSSLLRAHASDQDPPVSFSFRLVSRSLQVAASPCWEMAFPDVISTILV